jgi:hypothetical protein
MAATSAADIDGVREKATRSVPATCWNSVGMLPGQRACTLTPVPSSSRARASVSERTKALVAA